MAREYGRNQRVADLLQRELATLLQRDSSIRETGLITISFVDVSPDLKNAKVYFTCLQPVMSRQELTDLLNSKVKYLRQLLAKNLTLRVTPELAFMFDHSLSRAERLSELIDSVNQKP